MLSTAVYDGEQAEKGKRDLLVLLLLMLLLLSAFRIRTVNKNMNTEQVLTMLDYRICCGFFFHAFILNASISYRNHYCRAISTVLT